MIIQVENGVVTGEFIGFSVEELSANNPDLQFFEVNATSPLVGMSYSGGVLSGSPTPPYIPPPPSPVPASVTPRQIRQALTRFGVRAQVESAVAAGDQDLKDWWEFATVVERKHPMVVGMASALGIDSTTLDAIFMAAGAL